MIKKLYLLRHAEAARPIGCSDHERPLSNHGMQSCKAMNKYFLENNITPQMVLCSDALRTISTAKGVFAAIDSIKITNSKKLYNATAGEILKKIAKVDDLISSIMIVAHNPGIQKLALILADETALPHINHIKIEYPPCTLICYSFNINKWSQVQPESGRFEFIVTK